MAKPNQKQIFYFLTGLLGLFSILLLLFIYQFQSPVLFGDKLAIWRPYFEEMSLWEGFTTKSETHTYGMMYLLSGIAVKAFNYSVTADLFVNALLIISIPILSLVLLKRMYSKWLFSDAVVILITLSLAQTGTLLFNPHIHVYLPVFTLIFGIILSLKNQRLRMWLAVTSIFLAMFSTYAFIPAAVFVLIWAISTFRAKTDSFTYLETTIYISVFLACFAVNWGNSGSSHSLEKIDFFSTSQVGIVKDMMLNSFGLARLASLQWALIVIILFCLGLIRVRKVRPKNNAQTKNVIALILLSAGVFMLASSLGRSSFNPEIGTSSRYYTTLMLLPLGIYFLWRQESAKKQLLWIAVGLTIYISPIKSSIRQASTINSELKELEDCYNGCKTTDDFSNCIRKARPSFYPEAVRQKASVHMMYLKENNYGLFAD